MREIHLWDKDDEDAVREAKAQQALDQVIQLSQTDGWDRLTGVMEAEIDLRLRSLENSAKDDERNRGWLEALRFIKGYPERVITVADAELRRNRGA